MKKKVLAIVLAIAMVAMLAIGLVACNKTPSTNSEYEVPAFVPSNFKFGLICLHDESSTYDKNFIDAAKKAVSELGMKESQLIIKTNIPESDACETAARELVAQGCNIIFADSFGHEAHILKVAKDTPNVQFCHATGTTAHTENVANFHNAFASIYEGRYLAGVVAGLKLNEMIAAGKFTADQAKMGYVGAYTYAEVISGYTSFYLGAKSVCPTVTMDVQFTGSWYDVTEEKTAAEALIGRGCKLISQHADSMGAPNACEEAGVPNVSYNGSTISSCLNTFLVSSRIDWAPYFKYIIGQTANKDEIVADWTGDLTTGSVVLTNLNSKTIANGTVAKLMEVRNGLLNGTIHVFDCNNFTKGGQKITSHLADVNTDADFTPDTEVVENIGTPEEPHYVFFESKHRSAPYFDIQIDGITLINSKF